MRNHPHKAYVVLPTTDNSQESEVTTTRVGRALITTVVVQRLKFLQAVLKRRSSTSWRGEIFFTASLETHSLTRPGLITNPLSPQSTSERTLSRRSAALSVRRGWFCLLLTKSSEESYE